MAGISHINSKQYLKIRGPIALVGNSDRIIGSGLGAEIDSHATVIRFNLASTAPQYSVDVGSKSNYYILSPKISGLDGCSTTKSRSQLSRICRKNNIICMPGYERNVLKHKKEIWTINISNDEINDIFNKISEKIIAKFSLQNSPRTGIILLAALLRAGARPTLYGFDFESRAEASHYFDDERQVESTGAGHKPSIEFSVLNELKARNSIVIV